MKKALLLSIASVLSVVGFAQPYTNSWIDYSQTYYKIPISETGIYRITKEELETAGIPVSSFNPQNLQIFHKGVEQYISVVGEDDATWDNGDYVEFYAKKNDGELDTDLYEDPSDQPHKHYSLYTDTSAYFITWSTNNGKRFSPFFADNYGSYTKQPYYIHKSLTVLTDAYWDGSVYTDYALYSQYTDGEGWLSTNKNIVSKTNYSLSTPGYVSTGPNPILNGRFMGKSDAISASAYNHHINIIVGQDTIDKKLEGYYDYKFTKSLSSASISTNTVVAFNVINDLSAAADNNAVSYFEIEYPRNFDLQNQSSREFTFNGGAGSNTYMQFTNYNGTAPKPYIYDVTNGVKIECTQTSGSLDFIVPNAGITKTLVLTNTNNSKSVSKIEAVTFQEVDPSNNYDMLIITNNKLLNSVSDYAAYKQSRGFTPLVITVDQLYNQFYYGVNYHPLAIRHFCDYMISASSTAPEYLLLIGKGQTNDLMRKSSLSLSQNLVPTMGVPPTDYFFTSGLNGTNLEPAIATGRIPAKSNNDVTIYLNKLKEFESKTAELADKTILHLGGGRDESENNLFKVYLEGFADIAEDSLFGANTLAFYKDDALVGETALKQAIIDIINGGISHFTYFGHGAAETLEIDIGQASDLTNQGKYPNILFSGCILGNTYAGKSMCEDYLFQPNAGAISWMANSSYGFPNHLRRFTTFWYQNLYINNYGESLGTILIKTLKELQTDQSVLTLLQTPQITFQGDPSIILFSPDKPDYFVQTNNAYIKTENATALMDSIDIAIIVNNKGKATTDSLDIQLKRTLPNNSRVTYPIIRVPYIPNTQTITYTIPAGGGIARGINTFEVVIDPENKISELTSDGELNNNTIFTHFLPANGVDIITPTRNSIINTTSIKLKVQSSNLFTTSAEYIFEIDTTNKFNSSSKITSGVVSGDVFGEWTTTIPATDSVTYYWRAKLNIPIDEGGVWQNSAFTYINNGKKGWHQGHFYQFKDIVTNNINLDTNSRDFKFLRTTSDIYQIYTTGGNFGAGSPRYMRIDYLLARFGWISDGIALMVINPDNLSRYIEPTSYNQKSISHLYSGYEEKEYYKVGTYTGMYFYNTTTPAGRDSFIAFISRIPEGYNVQLHNGNTTGIDNWGQDMFDAFASIGANEIETKLQEKHPYICFGIKGSAVGSATELFADITLPTAPEAQTLTGFTLYYPYKTNGSFETEVIGPAKSWGQFYSNFSIDDTADNIGFEILGLDSANNFVSIDYTENDTLDLSNIDAKKYRQIKVVAYVEDISSFTPAQLHHWGVTFEEAPEGTIKPDLLYSFYKGELQEGDSVKVAIAYQNISDIDMDSVLVEITSIDEQRNEKLISLLTYPPLLAGEWFSINKEFSTVGYSGNNKLQITVNPNGTQPEQLLTNNILIESFSVTNDNINPILDVVFDGQHIMNDEIISPNPNIIVTAADENPYLFIDDTSDILLSLRYPGKNNFEQIYFNRSDITFTPATGNNKKAKVQFSPRDLETGTYELKAQAKDGSNNQAGEQEYNIRFQVIREASITHFYPYPNPFTTNMRFVFTLTGIEPPDYVKISIMTISGKIVREITTEELGPLHIGNNISEFSWDGTDMYGDKLANGVYLYKVTARLNGEDIKLRATSADGSFTKGVGKIYILR